MQKSIILHLLAVLLIQACSQSQQSSETKQNLPREKTVFQTSNPWKPVTDVRADVAIVYSVKDHHRKGNLTFEERVQTWRDKGYTTHFMTGIAWGEYQDYFTGEWDGKMHLDEGQVTQKGDMVRDPKGPGQFSQAAAAAPGFPDLDEMDLLPEVMYQVSCCTDEGFQILGFNVIGDISDDLFIRGYIQIGSQGEGGWAILVVHSSSVIDHLHMILASQGPERHLPRGFGDTQDFFDLGIIVFVQGPFPAPDREGGFFAEDKGGKIVELICDYGQGDRSRTVQVDQVDFFFPADGNDPEDRSGVQVKGKGKGSIGNIALSL